MARSASAGSRTRPAPQALSPSLWSRSGVYLVKADGVSRSLSTVSAFSLRPWLSPSFGILMLFKAPRPMSARCLNLRKNSPLTNARICLITVFASTAFYVVIVQLGFLLTERGFASPRLIGMAAAISALATPAGAMTFRLLRLPISGKLAISFAFSALGFLILGLSHSYFWTVVSATINGFGSGIVLPALITWALSNLGPSVRGRGTGAWES